MVPYHANAVPIIAAADTSLGRIFHVFGDHFYGEDKHHFGRIVKKLCDVHFASQAAAAVRAVLGRQPAL